LQQGLFVADLAYFTGEEGSVYAKVSPDELTPAPPGGYDYDLINGEVLLKKAKVENNELVLPDGMHYRVMVLQNRAAITLPLLRKVHALVKEGLMVVGARPQHSLGLREGTAAEFQQLTSELWGQANENAPVNNSLGQGRVFWGQPLPVSLQPSRLPG
jgi:hypothetical protein